MGLRDHLPGAGRRTTGQPEPATHYRSSHCELRGCHCRGKGGADIAIQDTTKQPLGYVCQRGYYDHLRDRNLDQWHTWKPTGAKLNEAKQGTLDAKGLHRFTDIVGELDRFADSYDHQEDDHDPD